MRSRSVTIFIAVVMKRRSPAVGWWSASSSTHFSSISTSYAFTCRSRSMTSWASSLSRSMSARIDPADLILDQAAHGQQRLLERVQLFVEMALHDAFSALTRTGR